jgi:hypothetical protein
MSIMDYFNWWRQAPFASALFQDLPVSTSQNRCIAANAVFKIVTGLDELQLAQASAEDFNVRAVFYSANTHLYYQVNSFAPEPGYQLVTLHQLPELPVSRQASIQPDAARLSATLLEITERFIGLQPQAVPAMLQLTLQQLGEAVRADRAYLFDYDFTRQSCSNTFEWCAPGIAPEIQSLQQVPLAAIPQWLNTHRHGREMYLPDVPSLPDDDALKQLLQPQGIKSLLTLPIADEQQLYGFVGFDSVRQYHYYTEQERLLLGMFARILVKLKHQAAVLGEE